MERRPPAPPEIALSEPLPINFDNIPEQLREYNHWVVWQYERVDDELKKPPYYPKTGKRASVGRCDTWGSFADAQTAYKTGKFAGVGIVLFQQMGIVGIDLDHYIVDGQPTRKAQQIITALDSYTETSPSGMGIRIMLAGNLPGTYRRRGTVELYEDARYLTLTGHHIADTPLEIQPRQQELSSVYHRIFRLDAQEKVLENTGGGSGPRPRLEHQLARSDETMLQKALKAKNGENFKRYYAGDTSLWEGAGAEHRSQSEADFTLTLLLLYWTKGDTT